MIGSRRPLQRKRSMRAFAPKLFGFTRSSAVGRTLLVASVAISAAATQASDAPSPSAEKLDRITTFFDHEVATGKLPGAVVLIQQHGRPIYLKCFGVRDVATTRLMTPDTIFALHSMTKPITSVAAMMLIDAG